MRGGTTGGADDYRPARCTLPLLGPARVRGCAPRDPGLLAAFAVAAFVVAALAVAALVGGASATAFGATARLLAGKAISPHDERGQLGSGFGDAVAFPPRVKPR